ncbi:helix-turn-helix domain-containing protein [Bacillus sp. FSL M8-0063]|uniref:helix-turn-helix domain-containing protein n=1 Tax=Bacillus sp. FSL M8-0063 TaxID=2921566 RepID=UPI0030F883FA
MRDDEVQNGEVYVKFFVGARNGLIAEMGAKLWTTYSVLATYMDRDGYCYPSQDQLARNLGIRRETVSRRIKELLDFRWKGDPLVTVERKRVNGNQFTNLVYCVNPTYAYRIFTESIEGDE